MKKKAALLLAMCLLTACLTTGCGGSATYQDGTYTGQSDVYVNDDGTEDGNGYGVVTLTITDGKISDCTYQTFEEDGTLKDENYGKEGGEIANQDFYNKAQKAVSAVDQYAAQLVETGDLKEVDAISGASINYDEFQQAVKDCLAQAKG